ncbi:MAG: VanZ family protein [Bacilli bacterium]|nr:VanZ family protein [Bacilli bacterium]
MHNLFIVIDFLSFILIYFVCFFPRWNLNKLNLFLKTALYIYFIFVIYFTLMPLFLPIPFINTNYTYWNLNLIPFYDIKLHHDNAIRELILNIIMLIPFGILVPIIYKKKFFKIVTYSFLISFIIEFLQLISVRKINSCDVTDLISNTLGGIIGYFIYLLFKKYILILFNKFNIQNKDNYNKINIIKIIILLLILLQLIIRSIIYLYI